MHDTLEAVGGEGRRYAQTFERADGDLHSVLGEIGV
jgi:hypothetical protein